MIIQMVSRRHTCPDISILLILLNKTYTQSHKWHFATYSPILSQMAYVLAFLNTKSCFLLCCCLGSLRQDQPKGCLSPHRRAPQEDLKKERSNSKEHLNQVSYYADVAIFPVLPSISSCALWAEPWRLHDTKLQAVVTSQVGTASASSACIWCAL